MRKRFARLWRKHRLVLLMFVASLALTVFFLARMAVFTVHWSDPQNQNLAIEGWMPVRYVARSWDVPPEVLGDALALTPGARMTVSDIAHARKTTVPAIGAELMAAITVWRVEHAGD